MSDEPFYSPTLKPPAPRQVQPGEHVWTMVKGARTYRAELRASEYGCELQILLDGELRGGHLHRDREWARAEASRRRETLSVKGWTERQ